MLPLRVSPSPLAMRVPFCGHQLRIHSATSLVIIRTLPFAPTTTLPSRPLLALTCMMTLLAPASLSRPDAPSSSILTSLHVLKSLTDVPPLDDFHLVYQKTTESLRTPVTSPDPAAARAVLDTSSARGPLLQMLRYRNTRPHSRTLTSVPLSSIPPPATVFLQHNEDLLAPSDAPNLPTSASSNPVPDNILPTVSTAPNASSETLLGTAGDDGTEAWLAQGKGRS
ncbi:hypothetical protein EDB92DRAFT_1492986 [Lactarius akahatsu]|uniref:Uncharacterized protein n=1 Tax=Lactarius akahatsu TaxID=416441 RepID=A0AAD4L8D3_9AGAM|nr:hypothetical protein EDB92DRAFT_1492986 [Lactarius akahatsu]